MPLLVYRAKALTSSSQDQWARVDLDIDGICSHVDKVPSVGGIPIKKDDIVYVYHPDDYTFLILGKSTGAQFTTSGGNPEASCSVIFDQNDGNNWSKMIACPNKVTIENSDGRKIEMVGDKIIFNNGDSPWLYAEKLIRELEKDSIRLNVLIDELVAIPAIGEVIKATMEALPKPDYDVDDLTDEKVQH